MGFEFRSEPPERIFDRESAAQITDALRTRFGQSLNLGKKRRLFQRSDELPWPAWAAMQKLAAKHLGEAETRHIQAVDAWLGVYLPVATEPDLIPLAAPGGPQIEINGGGEIDPKLLVALGSAVEKLKRDMPAPSLQVASLPAAHAEAAALLGRLGIPA